MTTEQVTIAAYAEEDRTVDGPGPSTPATRSILARYRLPRADVVLAILPVVVVIAWALVPSVFTDVDPLLGSTRDRLRPPSGQHWFGTDGLGRDLYSRVVHGASLSLRATIFALLIAFVASAVIGLVSGYVGGLVDTVLMRIIDVMLAIPSLLISLMLVTALGFGTLNIALAVGVSSIASFSRVMRSEVIRIRTSTFVEAARISGVGWFRILRRHIFPLARGPVVALSTVEFGSAILSISALSFLGYGAPPPAPEWGNLISEGRDYLATAWWLTSLPGVVVVVLVVAVNHLGRSVDPSRGGRR